MRSPPWGGFVGGDHRGTAALKSSRQYFHMIDHEDSKPQDFRADRSPLPPAFADFQRLASDAIRA
jgi:hypothetical protein